jgi:hypothetical protein
MCCIMFDIASAFDRVWHAGLIQKMWTMNIPIYLIRWVQEFLKERSFVVKINETTSPPNPSHAEFLKAQSSAQYSSQSS